MTTSLTRSGESIRAAIKRCLRDAARAYDDEDQDSADALMSAATELRSALVRLGKSAPKDLTFAEQENQRALELTRINLAGRSNGHVRV